MKVLVLGSSGFVGKSVVEYLQKTNHKIIEITGKNDLDLRQYPLLEAFLKNNLPEVIINCASHGGSLHYVTKYASDVIDDNTQIFLNLYRGVKQICHHAKVINPISNCSYPGDLDIQKESSYWKGPVHQSVFSFGNSRRMLVIISQCYQMQYGIKTVNFIMPNAYGPGDHMDPNKTHALDGMIIRMLQAQEQNDSQFEIWGTGKPKREWIYVKDMSKILAESVEVIPNTDFINVAQNESFSIEETAKMIKEEIGYQGSLIFNNSYPDGAPIKKMDDTLFKKEYPNFSFTDIQEGIKNTIKYYRSSL